MTRSPETKVQSMLPGFEAVAVVPKRRKSPQPRPRLPKRLTEDDFFHKDLSLGFRGEVNLWLRQEIDFPLSEVLKPREEEMLGLYCWPQDGRWLTQEEVALQTGKAANQTKAVRISVKSALVKIRRRKTHGPMAIETLKELGFLYPNMKRQDIDTIQDILAIQDERQIRHLCGGEFAVQRVQEALAERGEDWQPNVHHPLFPYQDR